MSGLDYDRSTACLTKALALYETLGMTEHEGPDPLPPRPELLQLPGGIWTSIGRFVIRRRPTPSCQHGLGAAHSVTSSTGGVQPLQASAPTRGLHDAERAISIADEVGNERLRRHATVLLGMLLADVGRTAEAVTVLHWTTGPTPPLPVTSLRVRVHVGRCREPGLPPGRSGRRRSPMVPARARRPPAQPGALLAPAPPGSPRSGRSGHRRPRRRPADPRRGGRQQVCRSIHRLVRGQARRGGCGCGRRPRADNHRTGNLHDEWTDPPGSR